MIKFLAAFSVIFCVAVADEPEWVPYVNPMMLGRTFDKSTNQVGVDIFDQSELPKTEVINGTQEIMKFKAGESEKSKRDLLDVGGSLALKIKGGFIQVSGSGQYVKEENKGEKYYELLTLVQRKTKTISLSSEAKALKYDGKIIGKHYVSHIMYGANMVASIRFKYKNDKEKEDIKAAIEGSIKDTSGSDSFDIQASADLSKLDEELNNQYSLEIKYYADVQLDDVPQNIEDMKALIKRFSTLVDTTTDNGMGRPIKAYVQPLKNLFPNEPDFVANDETNVRINDLENEISDIMSAKNTLYTALKNKRTLTDQQEQWTSDFYNVILEASRVYRKVISKLNLETGPEQFMETNAAYNKVKTVDSAIEECPSSKKKSEVDVIFANEYRLLAKKLLCHIESQSSGSAYDQQVEKILQIKKDYMDKLDRRNKFIDDVLVLSKDYTGRAKKIFQHYFMATREGEQSGLTTGGTVIFDNVRLSSPLKSGYDANTGVFTAPTKGVYLLSEHVSGTNMDMDRDGRGACPITQAHTNTVLKEMEEGATHTVTADTNNLIGESSFMGILVETAKTNEAPVCDMATDSLADEEEDEEEDEDEEETPEHKKEEYEDDDEEEWHS